jgi:hypothetical protein
MRCGGPGNLTRNAAATAGGIAAPQTGWHNDPAMQEAFDS